MGIPEIRLAHCNRDDGQTCTRVKKHDLRELQDAHDAPTVLRHSGLRLRMPNCVRLRGDGSDEVAGIAPDLPVTPIDDESDRARAWRLLQTVATDWRSHQAK